MKSLTSGLATSKVTYPNEKIANQVRNSISYIYNMTVLLSIYHCCWMHTFQLDVDDLRANIILCAFVYVPSSQAEHNDFEVNRMKDAYFGDFGGQFIPETLIEAHRELTKAYNEAKSDPKFIKDLAWYRKEYIGGPTPLHFCKRLTEKVKANSQKFKNYMMLLQPINE